MAAHLRRVQAGAAAYKHHPLQCADGGGRQREFGKFHAPFGEIGTVSQCGGHGLGLVHNLLEHEVAVAALVHQHVVAGDPSRLLDDGVAVQIEVSHTIAADHGHLPSLQEPHRRRPCPTLQHRQKGRQIAGDNALPLVVGDHDAPGVA